jgi:ABC-type transporter Mla maintaining outer membrane lipid asymmetry permease subunit MlaE
MIAIIVSAVVALAGMYLLRNPDAAGLAGFAWMFLISGTIGVVLNLALWAHTRRQPGRRR